MRRIIYSVAAILTALILIGLISLIAAAQQPSVPPTARPTNMSIGFPAITPHINPGNPNAPAFTTDDVKLFVSQHGSPAGPLVNGARLTFVKILFITSKEAGAIMEGESTGLSDNALVCYVVIHGPFVTKNAHVAPAANIRQPPVVSTTEIVFDARTGNLLVWGAPAAGY